MGVTGLWPILSELCERKPLRYLSGKRVAVDLSGWVVEAYLAKGLNNCKNPHLRNLFFRVSHLLTLGVHPIFVMEGKPPSVKEEAFKERNFIKETEHNSASSISRKAFDKTLKECQDLLNSLGVPCIKSSGEAEAFCAFLNLNGVVDGVITEDSDAFLYGAHVVYRDFSCERNNSHIDVYSLKSKSNKYQLNRNKLVALALLLGCDYSKGVHGIGKETALNFFTELNCEDVLQRFKDWKNLSESELFPGLNSNDIKKSAHCNRCGHIGSSSKHQKEGCVACDSQFTCYLPDSSKPCRCSWHINEELMIKWKYERKIYNAAKNCPDFPSTKVIEEYLSYTDSIPCEESLDWKCPNMMDFQERAHNYFGWTYETSFEKTLPLITSWQLFKIMNKCENEVNLIYEPVKVVKERKVQGIKYLEIQWKLLGDDIDAVPADNLITLEDKDNFSACYKEVAEEFYKLKSDLKEKKQCKNKGKKLKSDVGNQKVIFESELQTVGNSSMNQTLSPKLPLPNDSFHDFIDVPLWERVKAKLLLDHKKSPIIEAVNNNSNKIIDILFNEDARESDKFSCKSLNYSNTGYKSDVKENIKNVLSFPTSNNNLKLNNQSSTTNVSHTYSSDRRGIFCLNFSDSEDSFDLLLQSSEKSDDNMLQIHSIKRELLNDHFSPVNPATKSPENREYSKNSKCVQNLLNPLKRTSILSPCLIYTVKHSPYENVDKVYLNSSVSEIINKNTPLLKERLFLEDNHERTPESSNFVRKTVFTPLIFDSSTDDSLTETLQKTPKCSPRYLYSIKRSSLNSEDNAHLSPLVSEIIDDNCHVYEKISSGNNYISTPKLPRITSKVIFSPLFFDSSTDDVSVL